MERLDYILRWVWVIGLAAVALALLAATGFLPGDMLIVGPAPAGSHEPYVLSSTGLWFYGGGILLSLFGFLAWAWVRAKLLDAEESSE